MKAFAQGGEQAHFLSLLVPTLGCQVRGLMVRTEAVLKPYRLTQQRKEPNMFYATLALVLRIVMSQKKR